MQSLSIPVLTVLHILGYIAVFFVLDGTLDWQALVLFVLLIWISVVDADRFEIPDWAALLLATSALVALIALPPHRLADHLVGGVLWPLLFWAVSYGYLYVRGFHGLGFGDVKLMAGIGFWCGFLATIQVVLTAALAGILLLVLLGMSPRKSAAHFGQAKVAFGPLLCLCAWTIWLAGVQR